MNDKKVCLLNDSFPPQIDGVTNVVINYAKIINEKYGTAEVVTPYNPQADDSQFPFEVLRYKSFDTTKMFGYRAGYPFDLSAIGQLQQTEYGIIHSHCPIASLFLARTLSYNISAPVILTYHTKFDVDIKKVIANRAFQKTAIKALASNISAADEVWVVSRGAGENLRKIGYEGEYIVMPNGVDFDRRRAPDAKVKLLSDKYGLNINAPVFLFVGRMMWYKGIRLILDALARLINEKFDFQMIFVGDGVDCAAIKKYAKTVGVLHKCIFVGAITDRETLRAFYTRSDLFVFPSTFDTNGLVVREASACSLGSLLIRGSCAAEGTQDGVNSLHCDENSLSVYEGLKRVCENKNLSGTIGEQASRDLYLSWSDAVSAANSRYDTVLENWHCGLYHKNKSNAPLDGMVKLVAGLSKSISELHNIFAPDEK